MSFMTEATQRSVEDLPLLEAMDTETWSQDLSWVSPLFEQDRPGLARASWGDVVAYRNSDLLALRQHKDISHQKSSDQTAPYREAGVPYPALFEFFDYSTFTMQQPEHRPIKQLVSKPMTMQAASVFRDGFAGIVRDLLREACAADSIEFREQFAKPAVARFWALALDMPLDESVATVEAASAAFEAFLLTATPEQVLSADDGARVYIDTLTEAIRRTAARGTSPFVADLMAASDAAGMDPETAQKHFAMTLLDGFNTLGAFLTTQAFALAEAGIQPASVQGDPLTFSTAAFLEASRLHPSVLLTLRQATADLVHDDVFLPSGTNIVCLWLAGNRDPEVFPDPLRFQLERDNRAKQLTFGGGHYVCAGRNIVQALSEVMVAEMVRESVTWELEGPAEWVPATLTHELGSLPIRMRCG
jgi:cytochrome P450